MVDFDFGAGAALVSANQSTIQRTSRWGWRRSAAV